MAAKWRIVSNSAGGGGVTATIDLTLTANTNITSPTSPAPGDVLAVFITQNSTGGWTVTWDTIFRYPPTGLGTVASTISSMLFVARTDPADSVVRWWLMAPPVSNKT